MEDGACQQEDGEVAEHDGVAWDEAWSIDATIDVADYDTLQICPAHGQPDGDASLVDPFGIVGHPSGVVWDAGIDSHGGQESCGIFGSHGDVVQQNDEADDSEACHDHGEEAALTSPISEEADEDGGNCTQNVGTDGEELSFGGLVAQTSDNWKVSVCLSWGIRRGCLLVGKKRLKAYRGPPLPIQIMAYM